MDAVRWWIALFGLAACNQVFGSEHVLELDAADNRLLVPPAQTAACGAPPDLSTWHMAPRAYPGVNGSVIHPTFLDDDTVVFNYQGKFFTGSLEVAAAPLLGLDDSSGAMLYGASAAPGGNVFWYERYSNLGAGLFYAVHDGDHWSAHTADFSVVAYSIEPGSAAFYGGDVRMVAAIQPKIDGAWELHELASPDGTTWRDLGALPFTVPGLGAVDPMMTTDGCVLLYSADEMSLWVAFRRDDGTFTTPVQFPGTEAFPEVHQPAISPNHAMIWFDAPATGEFQVTP